MILDKIINMDIYSVSIIVIIVTYISGLLSTRSLKSRFSIIYFLAILSIFTTNLYHYSFLIASIYLLEGVLLGMERKRVSSLLSLVLSMLFISVNIEIIAPYQNLYLFMLLSLSLLVRDYTSQVVPANKSMTTSVIIVGMVMNHMVPGDQHYLLSVLFTSLIIISCIRFFIDPSLKDPYFLIQIFILSASLSSILILTSLVLYSITSSYILHKNKGLIKQSSILLLLIPLIDSSIFVRSMTDLMISIESIYVNWIILLLTASSIVLYLSSNKKSIKISKSDILPLILLSSIALSSSIIDKFYINMWPPVVSAVPLIFLSSMYFSRLNTLDIVPFYKELHGFLLRSYSKLRLLVKSTSVNIRLILVKTSSEARDHTKKVMKITSYLLLRAKNKTPKRLKGYINRKNSKFFYTLKDTIGAEYLVAIVFTFLILFIIFLGR